MIPSNCQIILSDAEQMHIDAFTTIEEALVEAIGIAYKADRYGKTKKSTQYWDYANDFMYLQILLTIMRLRVEEDIANCDIQTVDSYYELYNIECIKKRFACNGFDINPLLEEYNLERGSTSFGAGIGYMAIEEGNCDNIFQVG
jgi:hypothetical protein